MKEKSLALGAVVKVLELQSELESMRTARRLRVARASGFYSDWLRSSLPASDRASPPLWTFRCRRRFETTEKLRPHPSTSHLNAVSSRHVSGTDLTTTSTSCLVDVS